MRLDFVTLFPETLDSAFGASILRRAIEAGRLQVGSANPRDFATDARKTVDDKPYGGGPGMLMMAPVVDAAIRSLQPTNETKIVIPDPTGPRFTQEAAARLAVGTHVVFVCGHYEGIDDRIRQKWNAELYSLGDFIMTGGELPALSMADAIARLIPGILGDAQSLAIDSHSDGLLSAPQFTRPPEWEGFEVPEILLSGDHPKIEKWKRKQSLRLTRDLRPDLLARAMLESSDLGLLSDA